MNPVGLCYASVVFLVVATDYKEKKRNCSVTKTESTRDRSNMLTSLSSIFVTQPLFEGPVS